jgi:prevent-host-death family protein
MPRVSIAKGREDFPEIVKRAAKDKERTIVSRNGKDLAAVIPIEDLRLLDQLMKREIDRLDIKAAREALAEPEQNISLRELMKELGD